MSDRLTFALLFVVLFCVGVTVTVLARAAGVSRIGIEPLRLFVGALVCYALARRIWPVQTRPAWRWLAAFASASALLLLFNYLTMVP